MVRSAAVLLLIGGILAAGPAAAQFGNLFGGDNNPPRPPADVPNGPFPQQPPPPNSQYPDQSRPYPNEDQPPPYPSQVQSPPYPGEGAPAYPAGSSNPAGPTYPAASAPPSGIEAQPLPPPRGTAVAPVAPSGRAASQGPAPPTRPALVAPAPGSAPAPPANAPQGAAAAEAPPDDTVVERPTAHIDNRRAVFAGLDKITGRTISFDAAIGETVQFGALQVTPRRCYTRPATEATNTDAFVQVDEVTLQGEIKRIFTGWMFASSPGLHAVEHPIYDVWLTDCASPVQTSLAEPPAQPPEPVAAPRHSAPARRQRPSAPSPSPPPSPAPLD